MVDQIVVGVRSDRTRQKLWVEDSLDFEKTKKKCRADENAEKQISEIHANATSAVRAVSFKNKTFDRSRCGQRHGRRECPAYGRNCKKCNGLHHFSTMCKSHDDDDDVEERKQSKGNSKANKQNKKKFQSKKKVNAGSLTESDDEASENESTDYESSEYEYNVSFVRVSALYDEKYEEKWFEILRGKNPLKPLKVLLDTGAECNVMLY